MQIAEIAIVACNEKNRPMDWPTRTRSEPTTAGIAERSADRRRSPSWAGAGGTARARPGRRRRNRRFARSPTRGGTLVSSLRSEPRTFNRIVDRDVPVDLYSILTGSKLVRVNRATQEVEPALAETWTISPDNLTYTLTLRDGVTWSDGDAVHLRRRALHASRRSTTRRSTACSPASLHDRRQAADGDRARRADRGRQRCPAPFGPGIALLDNVHLVAEAQATRPRSRPARSRRRSASPRRRPTSSSIGPFKLT